MMDKMTDKMTNKKRHYGIVGLGPVGAIFAVHLKQVGHKVSALESNLAKVDHFKKRPIVIKGALEAQGKIENIYTNTGDFVESGPDVILICTKSSYTLEILRTLEAFHLKEKTMFVSCQNGIDVEELAGEIFGSSQSLRMILNFGCNYVGSAEIFVSFCYEHYLSKKTECHPMDDEICKDFNEIGLKVKLTENYKEEAFKKAILNSALGTICALTRMTMREVMEEAELLRMVKELVREAICVGKKMGYQLDDFFDSAIAYLSKGGEHKPSMLVDVEQHKRTENEFLCGKLFRYGEDYRLNIPVIQTSYYLVKNLERSLSLDTYVLERKV